MNKRFLPFGILILWLVVTGCTSSVYLTKYLPPEIDSSPGDRVGFINRFDFRSNTLIREKHDTAYYEAISTFANTLTANAMADQRISFFQAEDPAIIKSPFLIQNDQIPEAEISAFLKKHKATHLLTLDSLKLGFDWETVREEYEDGTVAKTKYIYLLSYYFLTLYDSEGVVRKTLLDRSIEYSVRPTLSGLITILPSLARAKPKIAILAEESALQYANMFYPYQENTEKLLHAGKPFNESNSLIQRGEYDAAIALLTPMTLGKRKSLARKAGQNLAVARDLSENQKSTSAQPTPVP